MRRWAGPGLLVGAVMDNLFLGIALAVLVAEPSMAADYPPPPIPPAAVPFDWGGIYSGIEGGGVTGKSNQINYLAPQNISPGYSLGGGQAGVTLGWNSHLFSDYGFSGIVWGIEADLSWVDSGGSALASSPPRDRIGTVEQWSGSFRPRLGYSFAAGNDRYVLAYATGGIAVTGVEATIADVSGSNDSHARWGWTVGGGLEFNVIPLTDRWTAKVEYRWAEYATQPYFPQNPRSTSDLRSNVPLEDNRFLLGLNRKSSNIFFF
jgi:opacity protein-like surface antigen